MKLYHQQSAFARQETITYSPQQYVAESTPNNGGDLPPNKRHPFNLNESKLKRQLDNGHQKNENIQTPGNPPNKESRFSIANTIEKSQYKPVGGSGWLNKYTQSVETKTGLVEYPRIKEGKEKRGPNNPEHWYWRYCWYQQGENGQQIYKKGKPVIECVGCPQKKVRAVERALAAKLPYRQILEIIKGENPTPPPT
ncbi:MAG: hypothetical protein F6K54_05640 [Okeania sp. SIO3B5]|uniref:hypothetical protein n=1 Tax=Okeania sp. SIO3B5 TaxID=2607811 RepID=UPI001400DA0C|nr:hypothetical protein [Okeania sp. SIO3B5]NEO52600.1 hypothetical protein [Okeania sp. SIO3B5]